MDMSKPTVPGWFWIRFYVDELDVDATLLRTLPPLGRDGSITECVYVFERDGVLMFVSRVPPQGETRIDEFSGEFVQGQMPPG
jgi:hypothetical protein